MDRGEGAWAGGSTFALKGPRTHAIESVVFRETVVTAFDLPGVREMHASAAARTLSAISSAVNPIRPTLTEKQAPPG